VANGKAVLEQANAAIRAGDHEGFLVHCTDDIEWSTVGDETIRGKDALRAWMRRAYVEPPTFTVEDLVEDGDLLVAIGAITLEVDGAMRDHRYADVWRLRDGRLAALRAFVVPVGPDGS
jgi:ketosteroid isomerase-like protein